MKKSLIAFLFFVLVLSSCKFENSQLLKIEGLDKNYSKENSVRIVLTNGFSKNLRYIVSAERKVDGKWIDSVTDVEATAFEKIARLRYSIQGGQTKTIIWPSKKTPILFLPRPGRYRLLITYVYDPNNTYLKSRYIGISGYMMHNWEIFKYYKKYSAEFDFE